GVLLGAMVSSAVLVGALLVGDSVDHTLGSLVDERLGGIEVAAVTGDRFFRAELAGEVAGTIGCDGAGVLTLGGMAANEDGSKRANRVQVLGVDEGFYRLVGAELRPAKWGDEIVINDRLADALEVAAGEEILVRVSKPGTLPMDVVLSTTDDMTAASRMKVRSVAGVEQFGRFGLEANQVGAMTVFMPISRLQEMVGQEGMANMLLLGGGGDGAAAEQAVDANLRLADVGLEIRELEGQIEVRSKRVFIDKFLEEAVVGADEDAESVLTYFVNELRCGERATPYSLVTAIDVFVGLEDDEIVINEWLAEDIGAGIGSEVKLAYFVTGPKRKLVEERRSFRVKSVVKMEGVAGDRELMPDFPGLADEENCRDWNPGIDVDLDRIRDKDEEYWDEYRGTPKAFVSLKAGRAMWDNRFGSLTAVRYANHKGTAEDFERKILAKIDGRAAGFNFMPVRAMGERAGAEGTDFGQLFAGLSMFLIAAAVLLTGLVFVFGVEKRRAQSGLLLAVGIESNVVRRILMAEGGVLSLAGSIAGCALGVVYTKVMILCLSTVWAGAAAGS
ncbi:MAG: ABC transporter permease, partial [Anaerohalosphaera sp.]|nr:ABC transporter permease [Anaerohalosphaera sp.]